MMLIIYYSIFKDIKGFLAEEFCERICKLAVVCFRCLRCSITRGVSHDIERSTRQKVRVHNCCVGEKCFILKKLFLVVKTNDCISCHLGSCSKGRWDQDFGYACLLAQVFAYIHRASATKTNEAGNILALVLFLYGFYSFNRRVRRYLIINFIFFDSHIIQPLVVNVRRSCSNDKSVIWVWELLCSIFAEHNLPWHQYFPSHQLVGYPPGVLCFTS